ncbi:MAG: hypothetical protein AAGH46_10295 [Bacteroidota bacterium]
MQEFNNLAKSADERQHLIFIQDIISRMSQCSFRLKQWMITLVAAVLGLSQTIPTKAFVLIALLPILVFWLLDAYYLHQERKYRVLYNECITNKAVRIYDLNTKKYLTGFCEYLKVIFSKSIWPLYFPLLGLIIFLFIYKR